MMSRAWHLCIFEQPVPKDFFNTLFARIIADSDRFDQSCLRASRNMFEKVRYSAIVFWQAVEKHPAAELRS
jgi:hypothetical protein